jgi:hypothetical protein
MLVFSCLGVVFVSSLFLGCCLVLDLSSSLMTFVAQGFVDLEDRYGANNYHPLPVVLEKVLSFALFFFCLVV